MAPRSRPAACPAACLAAPPPDARRRAVCAGLAVGLLAPGAVLAAAPGAARPPANPAMARLGARLAGDLPPAALADLRRLAAALRGVDADTRGARIAADFRAGRTVALRGVVLSRTEAACFLAAADASAGPDGEGSA